MSIAGNDAGMPLPLIEVLPVDDAGSAEQGLPVSSQVDVAGFGLALSSAMLRGWYAAVKVVEASPHYQCQYEAL